jgi:hypothetical protein
MTMTITYTWAVTSLKTRNEGTNENAVVQTYWKKTGTDEAGHTGEFSGATPFTTTTMPAGSTFIPLAELTEAIVLGWIQGVVTGSYEEHVNGMIAKQIAEKATPITEAALPWAPEATNPPAPTTPAP